MHMSFWWSPHVNNFLVSGLNIETLPAFIGLCFVIGCFAFMFEGLRYLQTKLNQRALILRSKQLRTVCPVVNESSTLLETPSISALSGQYPSPIQITLWQRCGLSGAELGLWFFLQTVGYFTMLIVMLYNGWFLVAAVVGGAFGYFVFGQLLLRINLQNCRIIKETYCKMENCGAATAGQLTPPHCEGASTPPPSNLQSCQSVNNSQNCVNFIKVQVECHKQ